MTKPSTGIRLFFILTTFLLSGSFLISSLTFADITTPVFERLDPISAQVQSPTGLALDHYGRVYIAQTTSNNVAIFSQSGRFLHAVTGQQEPISVTVDAASRIYIGNKKTGNVSVYSNAFSFLFKLGRGDGEFGFPSAIAVDNVSGTIYVADRSGSAVKTYNSDGSFRASIGQSGNGDGQFHKPVSLAIDSTAAELVVLDQQQRRDTFYGTMIRGARIQYFDLNGNFLRGYSKFGYNIDAGELAKPIHVAVDNTSRVYVTDSYRQRVLVYDNNNTFIGLIHDADHPLRTPIGQAIGGSNRLYVSSFLADQIEVYGIDNYSGMSVTPPALSFQAIEGGPNPPPQSTTIDNKGNIPCSWTANSKDSRIILAEAADTLPVSGSRTLAIGMDTQGLAPGIYRSNVDITNSSGAKETVSVALTVFDNPLQVAPGAMTFTAEIGTTPAGQPLSISTGGINPVNWTVVADQSWLSISKTSGMTPGNVRVYAAAENLPAGTYTGTVTFNNQEGEPAPVTVAVTLNLTDPGDTQTDPTDTPVIGQSDDNRKWTVTQVLPGTSLNGVWGSSSKNIYAVGSAGTILHKDSRKWNVMDSGSSTSLYSIWGSSSSDIYAVGDNGLVLHYDGQEWTPIQAVSEDTLRDVTGTETDVLAVDTYGTILSNSLASSSESGVALRSIWGSSDTNIFVAGEAGTILHYDGSAWDSMDSDTSQWLNSVWGSSESDVFAVGENGVIVHYDGTIWSSMDSGTSETLLSVWGGSGSDVFAVGASGLILHYNGTGWFPVTSGVVVSLNDVWVSAKSEVYAVGEDGIIISGKSRFPWLHFITNTILANAAFNEDDKGKENDKGLLPTIIIKK